MNEMSLVMRKLVVAIFMLGLSAGFLEARTIVLKSQDIDLIANIGEEGPRYSWLAYEDPVGFFRNAPVRFTTSRSMLLHCPLDKIPSGQHITYAELSVPVSWFKPTPARLYIWRVLAEWGVGVSHKYRMVRPRKVEWVVPGAKGNSSDRTTKPTTVVRVNENGEKNVNLTEDVEIWYTGMAPNYGWMFSVEDPDTEIQIPSPILDGRSTWELRITYEPQ
jgi:hypothetical protein